MFITIVTMSPNSRVCLCSYGNKQIKNSASFSNISVQSNYINYFFYTRLVWPCGTVDRGVVDGIAIDQCYVKVSLLNPRSGIPNLLAVSSTSVDQWIPTNSSATWYPPSGCSLYNPCPLGPTVNQG